MREKGEKKKRQWEREKLGRLYSMRRKDDKRMEGSKKGRKREREKERKEKELMRL